MSTESSRNQAAEQAALYAAGALAPHEAEAFEAQLAAGDEQALEALAELDAVVCALFDSVASVPVPEGLSDAVTGRVAEDARNAAHPTANPQIWRDWESDEQETALFVRRAADAVWEPTGIPGIETRRLFVDAPRNQMTMLVRMAAGTSYPRHVHAAPEECLVLEGDLHVGDEVLHAGDYQRAAPGSKHPVQSTEGGCLLMIVSSLSDELED